MMAKVCPPRCNSPVKILPLGHLGPRDEHGHAILDRSARDAVHRWRFSPGKAGGAPVSSTVTVPIQFALD